MILFNVYYFVICAFNLWNSAKKWHFLLNVWLSVLFELKRITDIFIEHMWRYSVYIFDVRILVSQFVKSIECEWKPKWHASFQEKYCHKSTTAHDNICLLFFFLFLYSFWHDRYLLRTSVYKQHFNRHQTKAMVIHFIWYYSIWQQKKIPYGNCWEN